MTLKLDNESELREAQAALFNINSTGGWVLLNYVGPSTVHFAAGGENFSDIAPQLEDDQIQYGVVRIGDIQEKGTLKTTIRDVFFCWIGPGVGIIEKGKKTAYFGDAEQYLQPFHAGITVLNKSHFTCDNVLDRSHPLSAALFNINSVSGWVLLNYVGPSTVHYVSGGEDFSEIADKLEDDQIQYGLARIGDIRERDVFFCWIGPGVGIIEKGKKTDFLGDAQQYLQPLSPDTSITVLNKSHFTRDNVVDRSNPSSGSHVIE
ncbi:hypothetical protein ACTFIZ_011779 [Dictyostelium cf. discoideum]